VLNLHHIRYAIAIAEHGHFGQAARSLGVSQPAVSRAVQSLEERLGVQLFERGRSGVTATAAGSRLLASARQLLLAADDLDRESELLRRIESRVLLVCLGPFPAARSGHRAVARLMASQPELRCQVRTAPWQEALEALLQRNADLVLAELSDELQADPRLETELVSSAPGVFCCRAGHPVLARPRVTVHELRRYPWVTTRLPARFGALLREEAPAGVVQEDTGDFAPAVEVDDVGQIPAIVAGSDAIGALSPCTIEHELERGELVALPGPEWLRARYGFIRLRQRSLSPIARAYMEAVRAVEAELDEKEATLRRRFLAPAHRAQIGRAAG
jgi:DNA-binding transcriptional LysR family regulator